MITQQAYVVTIRIAAIVRMPTATVNLTPDIDVFVYLDKRWME